MGAITVTCFVPLPHTVPCSSSHTQVHDPPHHRPGKLTGASCTHRPSARAGYPDRERLQTRLILTYAHQSPSWSQTHLPASGSRPTNLTLFLPNTECRLGLSWFHPHRPRPPCPPEISRSDRDEKKLEQSSEVVCLREGERMSC